MEKVLKEIDNRRDAMLATRHEGKYVCDDQRGWLLMDAMEVFAYRKRKSGEAVLYFKNESGYQHLFFSYGHHTGFKVKLLLENSIDLLEGTPAKEIALQYILGEATMDKLLGSLSKVLTDRGFEIAPIELSKINLKN